jgi:hypothetical protein
MTYTGITTFLLSSILALAPLQLSSSSTTTSKETLRKLHLLKKVFVEHIRGSEKEKNLGPSLKEELEKSGFTVVEEASASDAVLGGVIELEITGDARVPLKIIYKFELRLPSNEIAWKKEIKFPHKKSFEENHEYAARKIAEKMVADCKKSEERAARKRSDDV